MATSPRSAGRTGRRVTPRRVVGAVLLLVGLACLGYVGYQFWGTNLVSHRAYQQESESLRAQWQQPAAHPTSKPTGSVPPTPTPTAVVPGDAIALLRVPSFGAKYEVPILSGTGLDVLSRGVGHYSATALPGQIGNFAIAGHRVTHGEPFARLLELDQGDKVVVETRTAVYTYVIDEPPRALTVQPSDSWVLDPVPGQPKAAPTQALITLTTCQDLFHSSDRSVGFGHLASTKNKA